MQKSYDGKPTLFLIPVPIGNIDDITLRAIDVLKNVDVLFCEDTRETGLLLSQLKISKKLISNNEQSERNNINKVLDFLDKGLSVGIVSDQGSPVISDPGYILVREVANKGHNVVALPGANALIPALTVSGIEPSPFSFIGFLNSKSGKRCNELEALKDNTCTMIFYEAPHRIVDMLNDMKKIFGDRYISVSREISKKYEEVYRGSISDVLNELVIKGQFVIVVSGNRDIKKDVCVKKAVDDYISQGLSVNDAIKKVARANGLKKDDVYREFHDLNKE